MLLTRKHGLFYRKMTVALSLYKLITFAALRHQRPTPAHFLLPSTLSGMVLLNIFSLTDHDINMCWQWLSSTKCYFFKWTYLLFAYSNCFLLCFYWLAATITIHLRYRKSLKSLWFRISGVAKIRFFYVLASINTSILIDSTLKKWLNYLQHSLSQADKSLGRFGLHHDSFSLCGGYFAFERVFVFSPARKNETPKTKFWT